MNRERSPREIAEPAVVLAGAFATGAALWGKRITTPGMTWDDHAQTQSEVVGMCLELGMTHHEARSTEFFAELHARTETQRQIHNI